jgi:drug/metabolite transporter (DMT)-like permease
MGAIRLTSLATCVACFLCVGQLFIVKSDVANYLSSMSWQFYALSLVNAVFCTVIPVFLTMLAIERCGASITSQTGIIGPMITISLGVWLLDEKFTIYHTIGTIGVVLSMILLTKGINQKLNKDISIKT